MKKKRSLATKFVGDEDEAAAILAAVSRSLKGGKAKGKGWKPVAPALPPKEGKK